MFSIANIIHVVRFSFMGRTRKNAIRNLGYNYPARITDMVLDGESAEYVAAACVAVTMSSDG